MKENQVKSRYDVIDFQSQEEQDQFMLAMQMSMLPEFEKRIRQQSFQVLGCLIILLIGAKVAYLGFDKNEDLHLGIGLLLMLVPLPLLHDSVRTTKLIVGFTQNNIDDLNHVIEVIGFETVRHKIEEVIDFVLEKDDSDKL